MCTKISSGSSHNGTGVLFCVVQTPPKCREEYDSDNGTSPARRLERRLFSMPQLRSFPIVLVITLLAGYSLPISAQDDPPNTERIVDGPPKLYTFKRAIHPLTWVEWVSEPFFRSADGGFISKMAARKPHRSSEKTSGIT